VAIGPVQLLVLGFGHPEDQGEIRGELDRLRDNGLVRVIDALAVYKDADGNVKTLDDSQLSDDEQAAFGALPGGLDGRSAGRRLGRNGEATRRHGDTMRQLTDTAREMRQVQRSMQRTTQELLSETRVARPIRSANQEHAQP
jgi:hypothetical protein